MIRINLLPEGNVGLREKFLDDMVFLVLSLVLLYGGVYYMGKDIDSTIAGLDSSIATLNKTLQEHDLLIKKIGEFQSQKGTLEQQLSTIEKLKSAKTGPVRLMEEFSKIIPDKVWILKFSENDFALEVEGFSLGETFVSDFLKGLNGSHYFSEVVLHDVTTKSNVKVCDKTLDHSVWFKITAKVKYA